jgi:hypothetical protein
MPTTETVNTQQVLQMGSHTEKLQQTLQNQPLTTAHQLNEERKKKDEVKRTEVQDMEDMLPPESIHRDGRRRGLRMRNKETEEDEESADSGIASAEEPQGKNINLKV